MEIKHLNYIVSEKQILKDISFTIEKGQNIAIIGNNGSGKTTLLKMIAGLLPNQDHIVFEYGYLNLKKNPNDFRKLGCVFHDCFSFLFEDVYHELIFPLENLGFSAEKIPEIVKSLMTYFDVSYLLDKKIADLTEEEKALLFILLAIIHGPELLIMDDPFLMMHKDFKKKVMEKLFSFIKENHMTVIFASSDLEDVLFSKYIYVLEQGEIVMKGKTMEILKEDTRLKKLGLELPFMIDLSLMLQFYEILDDIYLDINQLVVKLWK